MNEPITDALVHYVAGVPQAVDFAYKGGYPICINETNGDLYVLVNNVITKVVSGGGSVLSVTGTAPIASSGGVNPAISLNDTAVTPGSYGSATTVATFTVDAKGRLTAAGSATIGIPVSAVTGLGTGVATALGVNVGSAGAVVTFNGALGTPSSGVATNLTGTAAGLTAGNATLAATVTTNANLTGHVTSVGNAAVLGSFTSLQLLTALTDETGTGANVFATSPTLVTPLLGTPSSGVLTNCTGYTDANLSTSDVTTNNATTAKHGFLLKLNNSSTQFMNGQGAWATPAITGAVAPLKTVYTTGSGTHTNTGSPLYVTIAMIGGGGGGGGSGTAGGSAGGDGGDTTFSTFTAGKGFGGTEGTGVAAGVGGNGGTNSGSPKVDIAGAKGDSQLGALTISVGNRGAGSFYGAGAIPTTGTGTAGIPKGTGGSGGAGATGVVNAGGGGGAGAYLEHLITSPAASYSYGVGAAGTAGSAGTSGFAGGAGVIGLIIVTEHYQ